MADPMLEEEAGALDKKAQKKAEKARKKEEKKKNKENQEDLSEEEERGSKLAVIFATIIFILSLFSSER